MFLRIRLVASAKVSGLPYWVRSTISDHGRRCASTCLAEESLALAGLRPKELERLPSFLPEVGVAAAGAA